MSTFTPRSSHISNAVYAQPAIGRQPSSRQAQCTTGRAMAGLLLFVDSLLNRCYLLVSGSVRVRISVKVRARARVSARVTVRDRDLGVTIAGRLHLRLGVTIASALFYHHGHRVNGSDP